MAKSCRCKKPAECEECPEWIFTFADLVMLMMGFFVILFVLKPEGKKAPPATPRRWKNESSGCMPSGKFARGSATRRTLRSADPVDQAYFQRAMGEKNGAENDTPRETCARRLDTTAPRSGPARRPWSAGILASMLAH